MECSISATFHVQNVMPFKLRIREAYLQTQYFNHHYDYFSVKHSLAFMKFQVERSVLKLSAVKEKPICYMWKSACRDSKFKGTSSLEA